MLRCKTSQIRPCSILQNVETTYRRAESFNRGQADGSSQEGCDVNISVNNGLVSTFALAPKCTACGESCPQRLLCSLEWLDIAVHASLVQTQLPTPSNEIRSSFPCLLLPSTLLFLQDKNLNTTICRQISAEIEEMTKRTRKWAWCYWSFSHNRTEIPMTDLQ